MNGYVWVIVGYSVVMIAAGFWLTKRVKGADDFFVAGRNLSAGMLFSTLLAANIGAGSTVGVAGLAYRYGVSAWWWIGALNGARLFFSLHSLQSPNRVIFASFTSNPILCSTFWFNLI